jgi:hypothetical protein
MLPTDEVIESRTSFTKINEGLPGSETSLERKNNDS